MFAFVGCGDSGLVCAGGYTNKWRSLETFWRGASPEARQVR